MSTVVLPLADADQFGETTPDVVWGQANVIVTTTTKLCDALVIDTIEVVNAPTKIMLEPQGLNYPDFAEVPKEARFAEFNTSLVALILTAVAILILMRTLYRRWFGTQALAELSRATPEEIPKQDSLLLAAFCRKYPAHPFIKTAAMEMGGRNLDDLNFETAAHYFKTAIRAGGAEHNPDAHFFLAECYLKMDYLCDAIDEWMACYLDDPSGPRAAESFRRAQRWRAHQIVHDREECFSCGADCRITDLKCERCGADLKRTVLACGVCRKPMVKEAKICIHCLPDEIKAEVAAGTKWPVLKMTTLDWEAEMIKSRLEAEGIPCTLTGERNRAIPLTVGYLGEIKVRVPFEHLKDAKELIGQDSAAPG